MASSRGHRQTGKYHRFDQSLHALHDTPAVAAVLSHLEWAGLWAEQNPDWFGPDIIVWRGFQPAFYIEVEQRRAWQSGAWPEHWEEVHIPERKGHMYFTLALPCEHWILSASLKEALILPDSLIQKCGESLKEFKNSRIQGGELFYHIPAAQAIQLELREPDHEQLETS